MEIVSQNGGILKEPWRTRVITAADKNFVTEIVNEEFNNVEKVTEDFLDGRIENY